MTSDDGGRPPRGPVTLADVAREAGVSIATASFVLSGRGGLRSAGSAETKAKVRAAAERLGYVPNRHAQAMRTGRGGGIVLALGTLEDPWGVRLATRVRDRALAHELSTLVLADERWYEYLLGASADAALVTSIDFVPEGPEQMRRLARSTQTGLVAFSAQMEPEGFDVVSSSPSPAIGAPTSGRAHGTSGCTCSPRRSTGPAASSPISAPVPSSRRSAPTATTPRRSCTSCPRAATTPTVRRSTGSRARTGPVRSSASPATRRWRCELAAERAGLSVPDDLEFVAIGDIPASSEFFGPISVYGVEDVFSRLAGILVDRAVDRTDRSGTKHVFDWRFFPGTTTADDA
ncbi:LacI family DNA-binding transcriptional regulator [Brachybacterium sp. GPGPB12]|uniref:LacI family DNA-binding transcriptional regulator n=1 Tax=Brachybacterium sp. GPGPB12 TaxID=3023517 RepID=UPI00313457F6